MGYSCKIFWLRHDFQGRDIISKVEWYSTFCDFRTRALCCRLWVQISEFEFGRERATKFSFSKNRRDLYNEYFFYHLPSFNFKNNRRKYCKILNYNLFTLLCIPQNGHICFWPGQSKNIYLECLFIVSFFRKKPKVKVKKPKNRVHHPPGTGWKKTCTCLPILRPFSEALPKVKSNISKRNFGIRVLKQYDTSAYFFHKNYSTLLYSGYGIFQGTETKGVYRLESD